MARNLTEFMLRKQMQSKDITGFVQRYESFEKRLGVYFKAISAFESSNDCAGDSEITIRGEMHPLSGTNIRMDIDILVSVQDAKGRVIQTGSDWVDSEKFYGFHTFEILCEIDTFLANKILLMPKAS